jgi:Undecaprenyl-phosphate glucose phosphotransferase
MSLSGGIYWKRQTENRARFLIAAVQMVGDVLILFASSALVVTFLIYTRTGFYRYLNVHLYLWTTAGGSLVLVLSLAHSSVYDPLSTTSSTQVLRRTAQRVFQGMLGLTGLFFILKVSDNFSRFWLLAWGGSSLLALCGLRLVARYVTRRLVDAGKLTKRVAVVGADKVGFGLATRLAQDRSGISLVGVFDEYRSGQVDGLPVGSMEALDSLAFETRVDEIIIAIPVSADERIAEYCRRYHPFPVALSVVTSRGFEQFRVLDNRRYGDITTFCVVGQPLGEVAYIIKWLEDKIIALLCLFAFLPFMLSIALAIKLDSPGPVLFRQKRLGANNGPFDLLKFRSMYANQADPLGRQLTRDGDPRVTRVGRVLRATSLDELPQLINVLRGDMSLVGPRPHALEARAGGVLYTNAVDNYPLRHRVKPGMTGWAQVNGWRGETTRIEQLKGRVECDLYYVDNWSLSFDLLILLRTVFTVLSRLNAL